MISDARLRYEIDNHPSIETYRKWKDKHPKVIQMFADFSLLCVEKGRFFGISLITERLRWEYFWEYNEDFKIRNEFRAIIIREIMLEYPEVQRFCTVKKLPWADDHFDADGNPIAPKDLFQ